jgi:hypothetical protein
MFRASTCPSSGATTTAVAASGSPSELGDSSAVGRGRAGPTCNMAYVGHSSIDLKARNQEQCRYVTTNIPRSA